MFALATLTLSPIVSRDVTIANNPDVVYFLRMCAYVQQNLKERRFSKPNGVVNRKGPMTRLCFKS